MQVGAVAPAAAGGLVVACEHGFGVVTGAGSFELRLPVLPAGERMNDAKCDSRGRLWAGSTEMSFAAGRGALHVLRPDWSTDVVMDGLTLPNGMGWSPDSTVYYLADSDQRASSSPSTSICGMARCRAGRTLIAFAAEDGKPDGLCIDSAGTLWVAMWGTSRLLRISPLGAIEDVVPLPVRQPSSWHVRRADARRPVRDLCQRRAGPGARQQQPRRVDLRCHRHRVDRRGADTLRSRAVQFGGSPCDGRA